MSKYEEEGISSGSGVYIYENLHFSRIVDDVEIKLEKNLIIISPVKKAREGWDKAFKMMADKGDDEPIIDDKAIAHSWDEEEWQW